MPYTRIKFELCLVVSCFEKYQDYYTLTKSVGMTDSYVGKRFCPQASLITRHVTSKPALEAKIEHWGFTDLYWDVIQDEVKLGQKQSCIKFK